MNKKSLVFLPILALVACSEVAETVEPKPRPVVSVNVEQAQSDVNSFIGSVEPHSSTALAFPLAGTILEKNVEISRIVKKGDVLAKLDPEDLKLQVETAEANLATLKAQFDASARAVDRINNLFKQGFATQKNLEDAKRRNASVKSFMEQTTSSINRAKNLVSLAVLEAPQNGIVTQVNAEVGAFVAAGIPIITLASTQDKEVVFSLTLQDSNLVSDEAKFEVNLLANEAIKAKAILQKIEPVANQQTRSRKVRLKLINPPEVVRLGALVNIKILSENRKFFKLPKSALFEKDGSKYLWVVDRNLSQAKLKKISISYMDDDVIHVATGLNAQDEVIVKGVNSIKDGQQVGKQVSE